MAIRLKLDGLRSPPLEATVGVPPQELEPFREKAEAALERLRKAPPAFLSGLEDRGLLAKIAAQVEAHRSARSVVILGIGGSALGARTIRDALLPTIATRQAPSLQVLDNIDPHTVAHAVSTADLKDSLFVVVSKSGSTAETIAQFLHFRARLRNEVGEGWRKHFLFITDPERGPLRELARRERIDALPIPPEVGGRFSVLSSVGLLPAALIGVDPEELLRGARQLRDAVLAGGKPRTNPLVELVALHTSLARLRGATIQVLMAYSDRLRTFGDWFCQLWAESLGKRLSRTGEEVWRGSTPLRAVGATDQHSLVQLFAEGPADKQYLFLSVRDPEARVPIDAEDAELHSEFSYLGGSSLEELFTAEREGTIRALQSAGRPVGELQIDRVDAPHLGALFLFFEMATALTGDLYDVNPYDQPGVEAGKVLAFSMMGRPGYREKADEIVRSAPSLESTEEFTLPPE